MTWTQRRGKFNAQRTEYAGRKYDSKHEASVAAELDLLLRAGEIKEIRPQYTFELRVNGHIVARHRVDFLLTLRTSLRPRIPISRPRISSTRRICSSSSTRAGRLRAQGRLAIRSSRTQNRELADGDLTAKRKQFAQFLKTRRGSCC